MRPIKYLCCLMALCLLLVGCGSKKTAPNDSDTETTVNTTIAFDVNSLSVAASEVAEIKPSISPRGAEVYWYSTDPNVVQVNGGKVLGISPGHAAIICYASNGAIASCNVHVTGAPVYLLKEDFQDYFDMKWSFGYVEDLNVDTSKLTTSSTDLIFNSHTCDITIAIRSLQEGRYVNSKITCQFVFTIDGQILYLESGSYKVPMGWQSVSFAIELDENGNGSTTITADFLNFYNPITRAYDFSVDKPELLEEHIITVMQGTYYPAQ